MEHTDSHGTHTHHGNDLWRRFVVSSAVTLPVLVLSPTIQQWAGFRLDFPYRDIITFLLATFIYFYGGQPFLSMTASELRERKPGMMTLISMAISVAYFYSVASLLLPTGKAFFWELATLIDIMLIGHYIEAKSVLGAADALKGLVELMPHQAMRFNTDGKLERIDISQLQPGDIILVHPGETVAADGIVEEGESMNDEALLSGESKPVAKRPGSPVYMGATNLDGSLRVRIAKSGEQSYLSQVIALVEEAQRSRSHTQDLANKAAGWLFYAATASGAVTFAVWSVLASPMDAVLRTVTVLVIACPHALGLAVPLVVAISTSIAAKQGILIRNRQAFETLRDIDIVCFDKTGTVTRGRLAVSRVVSLIDEATLLGYAAAIETRSEHSIARAVVTYAEAAGTPRFNAENFNAVAGVGVYAVIDGKRIGIGGSRLIEREQIDLPEALRPLASSAATQVWITVDDTVAGVLLLEDTVRDTSAAAVAALHAMGVETWMLTGDNEATAQKIAAQTNIARFRAGLLPDDKLRIIESLRKKGKRVAMVGDGVNDAPSLLGADIGIAIGTGTDIAIDSADIILTQSDLMSVVHALKLSRRTYAKMKQNLWWASGYNIVAIPLAAGVLAPWGVVIGPAFGAVLMSASTVIVALNAQLLKRSSQTRQKELS